MKSAFVGDITQLPIKLTLSKLNYKIDPKKWHFQKQNKKYSLCYSLEKDFKMCHVSPYHNRYFLAVDF